MSEYKASISWKRTTEDFHYDAFSRDHRWTFPGGGLLEASAARIFRGDDARVNPEEAFVASLSSCHMLLFLAVAARRRFVVDTYTDHAVGVLARNAEGELAMTRVALRPHVTFSGARRPSPEALRALHETAHQKCYLTNSVKTEVVVEPADVAQTA